ncbi:MAG: hypothetical protein DMF75_04140 [Acidobacteria bacterium]|nr:MAG: hypothetical protein DMF75_04140 [Acidobacteriota bacterium]
MTPSADIYSLAKTAYTLICGVAPRVFAHDPITDLPAPISFEPWAASIVRVLERATQTHPSDRYQSVQAFWDELHEAALPATQPLIYGRPRQISSDLSLDAEVLTAVAPPKPRFETSRELQQHEVAGNGALRPKIVVPIADRLVTMPAVPPFAPVQKASRVSVPISRNALASAQAGVGVMATKPRRRGRDFLVGVILVLCFAGLLLATGAYVRSLIRRQTTTQTTTTSIIGQQAVTTTDLNLRDGPSASNDQIGLAEAGSRVRVLNANGSNNWCEVQVLQHSRPKDDPTSADRGWVNKRFLKFD